MDGELTQSFESKLNLKSGSEDHYEIEPTPPHNWPSNLNYITTIVWDASVPPEKKIKYYDQFEATVSNFCEAKRDDNNEVYLISLYKLNRFSFLGEFVGYVEKESDSLIKNKNLCFPYYQSEDNNKFYLNTREGGNETRFMRWTKDTSTVNARLQRMWIDGVVKFFVEVVQEIDSSGEIIALENDALFNLWNYQENQEDLDFIHTQSTYMQFSEILWDKVSKQEEEILRKRKTLTELVEIRFIEQEDHPCKGQLGLFANRDLKQGIFLGEYTGRVLVNLEDVMTSKYLVDYSNPFEEDCDRVWVDAKNEGNELRFINDFKGTGKKENITFKRVWVGGMMRVCGQITADIQAGEEILTDYGEGYWNNLPTEAMEQ